MSVTNPEDDSLPSSTLDEMESPRKRMRYDNTTRKSWSFMDRRTDQEVLQEMGVSLLEPDDVESQYEAITPGSTGLHLKPNLKRKRDIENVNPNINGSISPRSKFSPKSPRTKCSPSPGTSKVKSPRSMEKIKHVQTTEQQLETTILEEYLIEEETPLAQSVSAEYMPHGQEFSASSVTSSGGNAKSRSFTPLGAEEDLILSRRKSIPDGDDSFAALSDEVMLSVFRWLPKRTLAHCMLVCKRWQRVACDETLWQRLDLGNKALTKDSLGRILSRKPIIVRLACSEIAEWHPTDPPLSSRIQYLDLSMVSTDLQTLNSLLERCSGLKKLSLENVALEDSTCEILEKCSNLDTLNLTMAQGITAEGVTCILKGCTSLQSLNISWCNLNEDALEVLVTMLPEKLQRLNIGGARLLTDDMVTRLTARCPRLLELDVSDCSRLGSPALCPLRALCRLEHLALSRCYLLPPHSLTKLSSMPALQYLEVWGMLQTASLNALRTALPTIQINQFMFSAIARPTVGTRRTSIWGLRTRD